MLGRVAHISAAAPGGPRYDRCLAPGERKAADNGIWLCTTCANLIGADVTAYPGEMIREWKIAAQKHARQELVFSHGQATHGALAEDASDDSIITLLEVNAPKGRALRSTSLPVALKQALIDYCPSSRFGRLDIYGIPSGDLRRRLHDYALSGSPAEIILAQECLNGKRPPAAS